MFSLLFLTTAITVFNLLGNAYSSMANVPIFDLVDESKGYAGTINERNVLVDLKPHLQIKNAESINGICSYHVFKPNNEEFPFTIEIKDKMTGEAVIEVIKKELSDKTPALDCNKRKEFTFLLQAHDCSQPSVASDKVPVSIVVLDHDDSKLEFEKSEPNYYKKVTTTNLVYDNLMMVRARDSDCTNNGYACAYQIVSRDQSNVPFRIDQTGLISSTMSLNEPRTYEFGVRAFDCISKENFVETSVKIEVVEPCLPTLSGSPNQISATSKLTNLFGDLKAKSCETDENTCKIDNVVSKVELIVDPASKSECVMEECDDSFYFKNTQSPAKKSVKVTLFQPNEHYDDDEDDGSLEKDDEYEYDDDDDSDDDEENQNRENLDLNGNTPPVNYQTFSKVNRNAQKIKFNGKFGDEFTLSAWIRREPKADKTIKEQVLCGTDMLAMNRHHFGLYFYKGNVKFLLRHEPSGVQNAGEPQFYPSLWEWSLNDKLNSDAKWHFYEVKFNTNKNVSLYIDGVKFVEEKSNSDIIDAYELNNVANVGSITTHIGACYHARTKSLIDFFEGDIGNVVLTKKVTTNVDKAKEPKKKSSVKCFKSCHEYIEMNMVGNENFIQSIKKSGQYEISVETSNLNDMTQLLQKINYVNNEIHDKKYESPRSVHVTTSIRCSSNGKVYKLNELDSKLLVKKAITEYNLVLEGQKNLNINKNDLVIGLQPFKHISISKMPINELENNGAKSTSAEYPADDEPVINLSQCIVRIIPERNLMAPLENNEKLMFLQSVMDEFKFTFEETLDQVIISGVKSIRSYEKFLRTLTYKIFNMKENEEPILIDNKQFELSCLRHDPNIQTNTITVKLVLEHLAPEGRDAFIETGYQAHKQAQRLVTLEKPNLIESLKTKSLTASPLAISFIVMSCCAIVFLVVVGVVRMRSSGFIFKKSRKLLINEENPQMEWDDSGLTIIENPLESVQKTNGINDAYELKLNKLEDHDDDEYSSSENSDSDGSYRDSDDDNDDDDDDDEHGNDGFRDGDSDEELHNKAVTARDLEWDDDTMPQSQHIRNK